MVYFTKHARRRLESFGLSRDIVIEALRRPEKVFYDTLTSNLIAVKLHEAKYLIVAFNVDKDIKVITVLLTSKHNIIINRERRGRWVRIA